ncbi:MAG: dihydrolipoyl dehydrogenase [Alphaproteobacteria bacterium]
MADTSFDLVVVGGGPGGYVAAIRAAQLGLQTACVEREHLGGICLNWGCIPTKALLRTSEINHLIQRAGDYGFTVENARFDLAKVVKRSRDIAAQLNNGVRHLLKKNKVTVFEGHARLAGKGRLAVSAEGKEIASLAARHIVLATGARARALPGVEPDGKLVWTYKEAMVPPEMPKSILVVGSGAIGIEFASFYRDMGADVTVIEVLPRILPVEDEEISGFARKALEKQGIRIHTDTTVKAVQKAKGNVTVVVETADKKTQSLTVDRVILAVGIVGNVEDLGLEGTGVKVDKAHIVTDAWGATGEPGVHAIGDVAGPPWTAPPPHEGVICVERIAGVKGLHPLAKDSIPGCTYCRPQVASVGLTEQAAKDNGRKVRVGRFPFIGNGKALALGEPDGLVKTVFDAETGELLGAHMIGAEVTELIQGYTVAKTLETTEAELMHAIFPHPTLSEMMHESVLAAYGRAIHI